MILQGAEKNEDLNGWVWALTILLSIVLHEVGHVISGCAHGYKFREAGILFYKIVPCAAYVIPEERKNESRWGRFRLHLSGIEMNLLLAGIFYILASLRGALSATMHEVARINVLLVVSNLFPLVGVDGEAVLSAVCGVDSIQKLARKILFSAKKRKKLLHSGLLGIGVYLFLGAVLLARVFFFLFVALYFILAVCGIV